LTEQTETTSSCWGSIVPYRNYFDGENEVLNLENTLFWEDIVEKSTGWLGPTPSTMHDLRPLMPCPLRLAPCSGCRLTFLEKSKSKALTPNFYCTTKKGCINP
jgi:hypothetical protein